MKRDLSGTTGPKWSRRPLTSSLYANSALHRGRTEPQPKLPKLSELNFVEERVERPKKNLIRWILKSQMNQRSICFPLCDLWTVLTLTSPSGWEIFHLLNNKNHFCLLCCLCFLIRTKMATRNKFENLLFHAAGGIILRGRGRHLSEKDEQRLVFCFLVALNVKKLTCNHVLSIRHVYRPLFLLFVHSHIFFI